MARRPFVPTIAELRRILAELDALPASDDGLEGLARLEWVGNQRNAERWFAAAATPSVVRDLLERHDALLEALEALFGADMAHVLMGDGKDDQVEAIAKARAAVAKARGA